eukprot:TRINITY_DN20836_c0_g1_i1.p1 TRINITY_DN20836_c0_g1~~TRINITY_DN20836_c0_g1_i1.p1  ORF type:complete len:304 (+),score=69.44 TRINITY_DN20836_c0_g1_i1:77-913(+)
MNSVIKLWWGTLCKPLGTRNIGRLGRWAKSVFRDTVFFFSEDEHPEVRGHVALTIDDGISRQGCDHSLAEDVLDMLAEHDAKATFFLCSDYIKGCEESLRRMLASGHELANHMPKDQEYMSMDKPEFKKHFLETKNALDAVSDNKAKVRWFRAPQAKYSTAMREVVEGEHGLRHALGDAYCDDWAIEDGQWVAKTILGQVQSGSVIIIHFPEKGYREHMREGIKLILEGLAAKGLKVVTLSRLAALAEGTAAQAEDEGAADTAGSEPADGPGPLICCI